MNKKRGKFIVIYGINNIGKTTQAKKLVKKLKKEGKRVEYIKYPIYNSRPTGKLIDEYLRKNNPNNFSPREFQMLHFFNKVDFEARLKEKLKKGVNVIAEDYSGTAIAWGTGSGVERKLLEYLYSFVLKEDLAILLSGKRFFSSEEKNHKHERDRKLLDIVEKKHLNLAKKYKWKKMRANRTVDEVHEEIWEIVKKFL